ncbi:unnamed protein product, partial [Cylicocyclus nassatus]
MTVAMMFLHELLLAFSLVVLGSEGKCHFNWPECYYGCLTLRSHPVIYYSGVVKLYPDCIEACQHFRNSSLREFMKPQPCSLKEPCPFNRAECYNDCQLLRSHYVLYDAGVTIHP